MKNQYKTEYDNIKLTESQKNILITKMQKADTNKKVINFNRKAFTRAVAACLAIAIICTGFFFTKTTPKNSFTIIANAAEVQTLPDNAIAMYSRTGNTPLGQYNKKTGTYDIVSQFMLTDFSIQGAGIKTVEIKSNHKSCDFWFIKPKKFDAEKIYDSAFLNEHENILSDTILYENKNSSDEIQTLHFDTLINYWIHADGNDPNTKKWIDRINEIIKYKYEYNKNDNTINEFEEDKLNLELYKCTYNFTDKILRNATISIIITFTDGTKETQLIDVDYILKNSNGKIVYDEKHDNYNETSDNHSYNDSIIFRYAE